jgi:hypothetical protein
VSLGGFRSRSGFHGSRPGCTERTGVG